MLKKVVNALLVFISLFLIICIVFFLFIRNHRIKKMEGAVSSIVLKDTLNFHYSSSGHIVIQVKSSKDGKEYPFLLDSGAQNTIFKTTFEGISFEDNGYGFGIGANGGSFFTEIKRSGNISIANQEFSNLNFAFKEFSFDCTENIIGIIGIGLMRHLIWKIDFEKNKIYLSHQSTQNSSGELIKASLSRNLFSNHLFWTINKDSGNPIKLLIDLGSNTAICLDEDEATHLNQIKTKRIFGFGSKGLDGTYEGGNEEKFVLIDSINFDQKVFRNFPIYTSPDGVNLLGIGFLRQFKSITLDWKNSLLTLEKKEKDNPNFLWNTYGMHLDFSKGRMIVNSIIENSPAFNNGVTVDTEVLEINHKSASNENEFCSLTNIEMEKDSVILKVSNGILGARFISLRKKPIF